MPTAALTVWAVAASPPLVALYKSRVAVQRTPCGTPGQLYSSCPIDAHPLSAQTPIVAIAIILSMAQSFFAGFVVLVVLMVLMVFGESLKPLVSTMSIWRPPSTSMTGNIWSAISM